MGKRADLERFRNSSTRNSDYLFSNDKAIKTESKTCSREWTFSVAEVIFTGQKRMKRNSMENYAEKVSFFRNPDGGFL